MQIIQLYIEGQRVDLFKDESISITQSIQNVKDIAKVFTDFSKTFSIPASKTNNKIFKHYYNFDIENGFDARKKKDAIIELNNITFKEGKIKLEGVDLKNNLPHTYRITFFGNTVSLKDLLGEDKLQSLSDLDSLSKVYDVSGIKGGLQLDPATNDVIVPLITHTQRLIYDSTSSNHLDDNIADTGGNQNIHGVKYTELKYALRIHKIVEAIESKYNITFSDDFFVNTNASYYNLFMWLHRKKGDVQNLSGINQSIVNNFSATLFDQDTESQMVNTSTLRIAGVINLYTAVNLILTPSTATPYKVLVFKDGVQVYKSSVVTSSLTVTKSDIDLSQAYYTVFIQSDANISFTNISWYVQYSEPFSPVNENISYSTGSFTHVSAFDFTITQQIPEMKVIDFLTGLFKMFNLTAYVEDDVVVVKTLDSFYSSGNSYDISKYLEVDKSAVNVALPYREINFSYEDTGTFLAKQHTQLAGEEWAKTSYNGDGDKLDGGLYSVKLPFGHIKNERLIDEFDKSATGIMYGYYVDDNQESYIGKPLLFYPIKQTGQETISFVNSSTSKSALSTYIIPSNSLALSVSTSKVNINFNNASNEYTGTNDFTDTLFQVYYRNYITNIFNSTNRLTKVSAYLPLRILYNYTLADRFVINGRSYKINSIKTNLETGKSELELLNDL
jgi:hypothetical protein